MDGAPPPTEPSAPSAPVVVASPPPPPPVEVLESAPAAGEGAESPVLPPAPEPASPGADAFAEDGDEEEDEDVAMKDVDPAPVEPTSASPSQAQSPAAPALVPLLTSADSSSQAPATQGPPPATQTQSETPAGSSNGSRVGSDPPPAQQPRSASSSSIHSGPGAVPTTSASASPRPSHSQSHSTSPHLAQATHARSPSPPPKEAEPAVTPGSPNRSIARMSTGGALSSQAQPQPSPQQPESVPMQATASGSQSQSHSKSQHDDAIEVDELEADDDNGGTHASSELSEAESSEDEGALSNRYPVAASPSSAGPSSNTGGATASGSNSNKKRPRQSVSGAQGQGGSGEVDMHNRAKHLPLPHYTVLRCKGANSKANPHILRINPGVTDGGSERWPQGDVLKKGNRNGDAYNWYEEIPLDTGRNLSTRMNVAKAVAKELGLTGQTAGGKDEEWLLEDWPEHYKFYLHHSGKDRTDPYIYGTYTAPKFRTANEIIPHIYWLLANEGNALKCKCKYCSKVKLQSEVNAQLGLVDGRNTHHRSGSFGPSSSNKPRLTSGSPRPSPSSTHKLHSASKPHKDRDPDRQPKKKQPHKPHHLASSSTVAHHHELVKVLTYDGAFTDPTREHDLSEGALFRKGEMVWAELPSPIRSHAASDRLAITYWPAVIESRSPHQVPKALDVGAAGKAPKSNVVQSWKYRVKLLALSDTIGRSETQIKPWLGYESPLPTDPEAIVAPESVRLVYDGQKVLRPSLDRIVNVRIAATPYALALQIAAHVLASFCLNDRYVLKDSHILDLPHLSDFDRLERAKHLERWQYHSFWWGAERIWSGELVRLLVDDNVISADRLSPNAGGADQRLVLIKITGVYKDRETGSGNVSGHLYELTKIDTSSASNGGSIGMGPGVDGSAMSLFEKNVSHGAKKTRAPEEQYMPAPPPGYFFRRVTPPGEEVHLDIEYVAGRYYPLPVHLHAQDVVDVVMRGLGDSDPEGVLNTEVQDYLDENARAVVLSGLVPSYRAYMKECYTWYDVRSSAMSTAEKESRKEMSKYITLSNDNNRL